MIANGASFINFANALALATPPTSGETTTISSKSKILDNQLIQVNRKYDRMVYQSNLVFEPSVSP